MVNSSVLLRRGVLLSFLLRSQAFSPATTSRVAVSFPQVTKSSSYSKKTVWVRSMSSSTPESKKRVLVPIGNDSEEIETTCITDTLTRFGAQVTVASVSGELVCTMSRGIKIMADMTIEEASTQEWDLIALPGGMPGAQNLKDSAALTKLLQEQKAMKKLYGAVCASPAVVLASQDLLPVGGGSTCYPAPVFREVLTQPSDEDVVVQDNCITSQGPGTSLLFALSLGEQLYGKEKRDEIAKAMLVL